MPTGGLVRYQPPVAGPVVDVFRAPPHRYGPGNRGIDLATAPGAPVRAAADGIVVFAGQVGGSHHVTVLHPDGLRTTVSFLATVATARGQQVARAELLGTSSGRVHLGVRDTAGCYLDPSALFGAARRPRLLPLLERHHRIAATLVAAATSS